MKLKFVLYCTILFCTVSSLTRAGTWDTLYTRQTNMDVGGVTFAPDDSFVIVTGVDADSRIAVTKFYRPSDGVLLDEKPFWFGGFSQDGKYALIYENHGKVPMLVDWRNNWQVITTFEWDSLSNTYTISADNQTLVGFNAKGYTLWDAQTGKQRKQAQIFRDTVLSGSGQNSTDKITSLQGSALLGDSRTLCIVVNQYVFSGSLNKELSNKYYGISIDIETGELKAGADNIRAFYAIPGSTDVIVLGKNDVKKIDYNAYFLFNGLQLNKRFQYQLKLGQAFITFYQGGDYFLHNTQGGGTLSIVETSTGKEVCKALGEDGWAVPASISQDMKYIMAGNGYMMMYSVDKLCGTTSVTSDVQKHPTLLPMPTSGLLTIHDINIDETTPISSVKILDNLGNTSQVSTTLIRQGNQSVEFDVSILPNGKYTITFKQLDTVFSYSFILIK
ncbi:MAG: T9SS type A sorting domain-containing protein [Bacteriodetes bacterium]|nr:T9SS type A sorting domain-containing protein [Bacteroidota bacterium]